MTGVRRPAGEFPPGTRVGGDRTRAQGWALTVPETWYEFDVRPQSRDAAINDVVRARLRQLPALAPHRADLVRLLRRLAREAWDSGAIYCAAMAEGLDREAPLTA